MVIKKINSVFIVVFIGNFLAFVNDTSITWSSPVLPKLISNDTTINPLRSSISPNEKSWIGSLPYLGAMLGSVPWGFLSDKIGRKPILILLAVPHITAYALFAFAKNIHLFYIGRFLNGISLSGVYIVLPMYIAEVAESSHRGMLLMSYGIFACLGNLFCYVLAPFVSFETFNFTLSIIPIVFICAFIVVAPESPHFLVGTNNDQAKKVLQSLRSNQTVIQNELDDIGNEKFNNKKGDTWNTLRKKHVIKGFFISMVVCLIMNLSGILAILSYTELIFKAANLSIPADICSIIIGATLFVAAIVGTVIVDRKGRRFLLLFSALGMAVPELYLGLYFYAQDRTTYNLHYVSWTPVLCLMIYIIAFSIGFGPVSFTIVSEILPSNVKFLLVSIVNLVGWMVGFLMAKFFDDMNIALGRSGTFWFFAGCCLFGFIFTYYVVPETKGKTFQEIHDILDGPFLLTADKNSLKRKDIP